MKTHPTIGRSGENDSLPILWVESAKPFEKYNAARLYSSLRSSPAAVSPTPPSVLLREGLAAPSLPARSGERRRGHLMTGGRLPRFASPEFMPGSTLSDNRP